MPSLKQLIHLVCGRRIHVDNLPLSWYVEKLARGEPFSFARYGDGEWNAILGVKGANCDGHEYFPTLGAALRGAIERPLPYYYAMQRSALRDMGLRIARFLEKHRGAVRRWHDADVFHRASGKGLLFPLVRQLRCMDIVIIGPPHLRPLSDGVVPYRHFIEISPRNCFVAADDIRAQALAYGQGRRGIVYAFSASMTANVIIHDLFPQLGGSNWLIDFGSLWDAFAGAPSRGYQRDSGFKESLRRNLGEGM